MYCIRSSCLIFESCPYRESAIYSVASCLAPSCTLTDYRSMFIRVHEVQLRRTKTQTLRGARIQTIGRQRRLRGQRGGRTGQTEGVPGCALFHLIKTVQRVTRALSSN